MPIKSPTTPDSASHFAMDTRRQTTLTPARINANEPTKARMNKFLKSGAPKSAPSPELQEKVKAKKQELKALKTELKTADATKKAEIQAKLKALNKELKIIAPKGGTW